ncbi:MAG TPA: NAD-dependent epimerase/dehydratase family protein [Candidatus Paceibacterota bacterium]|nr:NAD-dependent epimerase/dehydratase family protein [Candidatus Paceibacterota bacterium]
MGGTGKKGLILVTGGAGFIGSHLAERLAKDGYRVVSLDDYSTGSTENHVAGVEYREGHTKDIEALVPETPDVVFHLGEYPRVEQSFADIERVLSSNVIGTSAVVEFCRKRNVKLVYAGSSTKFADGGIGRDQSPYAWTKATNTERVRNYGEWFGMPYAIAYFYNVYGPRERGDAGSGTLIGIFKERFEAGKPLPVRTPGTQRRNFTHVDDIVEGLMLIGERGAGDEYGLGHTDSYSVMEVAGLFGGPIEMLPERPGNRMTSQVDVNRARLELGWEPKWDLPAYIASLKKHAH